MNAVGSGCPLSTAIMPYQQKLPNDVLLTITQLIPHTIEIPYWTFQKSPPKSPVRGIYALLGNLALTSQFLRGVAQRELFRSICIRPNQSSERLLSIFQNNPQLHHHVRACIIVVECVDQPGQPAEAEAPFVASEVPLLIEGLEGLESFGLASKMRWVDIAWVHLPDKVRLSIGRCWKSNAKTLQTFCATRNLLFPSNFLAHRLPENVGIINLCEDEHPAVGFRGTLQRQRTVARQFTGTVDDTDCGEPLIPRPLSLAFRLAEGGDGIQSKASEEPDEFFSRLASLTIEVDETAIVRCEEFLRNRLLPSLKHLEIAQTFYCK
jgi:hypothetical protein